MLKIVLAFYCVTSVTCYTIIGDHIDVFPSQRPNRDDARTFLRVDSQNRIEVVACPDKFLFDAHQLKCTYTGRHQNVVDDGVCPENLRGTVPYKSNCRFYVSCWDGRGVVEKCGLNLLYNDHISHCDYPERANCCEFVEKNATVLV